MNSIFSKIKQAREILQLTGENFAIACKVNTSDIPKFENGQKKFLPPSLVQYLNKEGFDLNSLFDDSKKLVRQSYELTSLNEPTILYKTNHEIGIPLVSVQALAGFGNADFRIEKKDIVDYYNIAEFKDVDFYIKMKGKSMLPNYHHGSILGCKIIYNEKNIIWGMPYVIASTIHGILMKRITQSKAKKHWTLVSDNGQLFQPFDIPADDATGIALVKGCATIYSE